jgi:hypothetical protein
LERGRGEAIKKAAKPPTKYPRSKAANKIPQRSKTTNPRFAANRKRSPAKRKIIGTHPTSGYHPRLPTVGTFGAKNNNSPD